MLAMNCLIVLLVTVGLTQGEPCAGATFAAGETALLVESSSRVSLVSEGNPGCTVLLGVMLVGGGGDGSAFELHGGGSGYVDYKQLEVDPSHKLSVEIGRGGNFGSSGKDTTISYYGGDLLFGVPGGVGGEESGENGGNGYSGGGCGGTGGQPGGHGGEDGGDGEHSPFSGDGGRGSGVDIQKFPLREFDLQFGKYGVKAGGGGGGGGGVVVLGHNPPELRDHEPSDGEGWGAGSGAGWATQGVVLLEIID